MTIEDQLDEAVFMLEVERAKVAQLLIRQTELHQTIVRISQETPFPEEVAGALRQVGLLTAEVGTQKAAVRAAHEGVQLGSKIIRQLATALETAIGRLSSVAKDDDEIAEVESLTNTLDEAIREWG